MAEGDGEAQADDPKEGADPKAGKRRRVRRMQRYVVNPPMKVLTRWGLIPGNVLVETTGRRSGQPRTTVVGLHADPADDAVWWIVAEHGHHATYVRNIEADPAVRICRKRRWHPARAEIIADDDPEARLATISRSHASAIRRFGTDLLSIRVVLDPPAPPAPATPEA
jgi:deazaflavin-dependent oxidoreductase (nitroreductase family)